MEGKEGDKRLGEGCMVGHKHVMSRLTIEPRAPGMIEYRLVIQLAPCSTSTQSGFSMEEARTPLFAKVAMLLGSLGFCLRLMHLVKEMA